MKPNLFQLLCLTLLAAARLSSAAQPDYQVEIDYAAAPDCEAFATKAKAIAEEWYPKINTILFGATLRV